MSQSDQTLYLVILISLVSLVALLLLDYHIHRKRSSIIKISQFRTERSGPVAPVPILTVPEPAPLPRLQPLRFMDVFRRSLKDYRANLVLLVPPLVHLVESRLAAAIIAKYSLNHYGLLFLLNGLVTIVVYFFVLFGEFSMTAAVVSRGKTTLRDWLVSLKYFWTVIGLGILFGLLVGAPYIAALPLYQGVKSNGTAITSVVYSLITVPLATLGDTVLLVCLAAVTLDNKNLSESLHMGWRVIADRRSAYAGVFIFYTLVEFCFTESYYLIAENSWTSYAVILVSLVIGPLFLLIPFRIYWGFNRCVQCGTQVPVGSKFCPNCGIEQEH